MTHVFAHMPVTTESSRRHDRHANYEFQGTLCFHALGLAEKETLYFGVDLIRCVFQAAHITTARYDYVDEETFHKEVAHVAEQAPSDTIHIIVTPNPMSARYAEDKDWIKLFGALKNNGIEAEELRCNWIMGARAGRAVIRASIENIISHCNKL